MLLKGQDAFKQSLQIYLCVEISIGTPTDKKDYTKIELRGSLK